MSQFYSHDDTVKHGEMLANRVKKNLKHRRKFFKRQGTNSFRLYDWDIPEIRAVVDWYDGALVVGEYVRDQTKDIPWLETVSEILAEALELPLDKVYLKRRQTRPSVWGKRYERLDKSDSYQEVQEQGLKFSVNLSDYLDTGLFMDHRQTRAMLREQVKGKRVLNLFAYTGSFSVYAADGGASEVCTVDLSSKYIDWSKDNFALNQLDLEPHQFVVADVLTFIDEAYQDGQQWDYIVLDPPSFSTRKESFEFDILRDHPDLIKRTMKLLAPEGTLYFSTNHQRFQEHFNSIDADYQEITKDTIPLDYQGREVHRCFTFKHRVSHDS